MILCRCRRSRVHTIEPLFWPTFAINQTETLKETNCKPTEEVITRQTVSSCDTEMNADQIRSKGKLITIVFRDITVINIYSLPLATGFYYFWLVLSFDFIQRVRLTRLIICGHSLGWYLKWIGVLAIVAIQPPIIGLRPIEAYQMPVSVTMTK